MVLLYGEALGNTVEGRRLYTERFPNRRIPDSRTFSATVQRVRDHGKFDSPTHEFMIMIWDVQEVTTFWKKNIRENSEMLVRIGFFGPKDTSLHE
jgi:hypothetical protein